MDTGTDNPIAQEEQKMMSLVKKVKSLESQLKEAKMVVTRLRDLINQCHCECFPPELKVDSDR